MNEQSGHLSNAQIESYGERTSGAAADDQQKEEQWVAAHLESCQSCRDRVLNFHRAHFGLLKDSALATSGSADLEAGNASPGSQAVNSGRIASASGNWQSDGGMRPQTTQDAQAYSGQNTLGSGQRTAQTVNTVATPDCPSADELRRLAAGLLEPAQVEQLNRHITACDHCGPLLQAYIEDFSDDFSPEEQAVLARLQSSSSSWQQQTARKILNAATLGAKEIDPASAPNARFNIPEASAASSSVLGTAAISGMSAGRDGDSNATTTTNDSIPADKTVADLSKDHADVSSENVGPSTAISLKPAKSPHFWKWLPIPATAAALAAAVCVIVALGGVGVWYARRDTPEKVEKLLAQAYTENRNLELRIPHANHSDFHQLRSGNDNSLLGFSLPFHEASDEIAQQLNKHPEDPHWLLLSAQIKLLDWHYADALSTLDKIQDAMPEDLTEFKLTRALALYERGEFEPDQPRAYGQAIDLLGQVLQQQPDNSVALHNQAILCEKIRMYECAVSDWEKLITVEKDAGWLAEAREHLAQINEKKNPAPKP